MFHSFGNSLSMLSGLTLSTEIDMVAAILEANTEASFLKAVTTAAQKCGFERVLVGTQWNDPRGDSRFHVVSGYAEPWQLQYASRGYMQADPTVAYCQTHADSVLWSPDLFSSSDLSRELYEEALGQGLGHGLSVGVHESMGVKSMVSLVRDQAISPHTSEERLLRTRSALVANIAHMQLRAMLRDAVEPHMDVRLSPQEREVLRLVARGLTSQAISDVLHIAEPTVVFHMTNATKKLKCKNRPQAVATAFRLGMLD